MAKKKQTQKESSFEGVSQERLSAKKDWVIHQNDIHIEIKKGDDVGSLKVPERFMQSLRAEGVI